MRRPISACLLVFSALGFGCAAGVSYGGREHAAVRANPTPELYTLYQRSIDVDNALTIMQNSNVRMYNQDFGRVFYTDRPSRLTPEPVPR